MFIGIGALLILFRGMDEPDDDGDEETEETDGLSTTLAVLPSIPFMITACFNGPAVIGRFIN